MRVSIHTPTKGVTSFADGFENTVNGFNPHTHEGCDFNYIARYNGLGVSIHTPTKGVTLGC